MQAWRGLTPVDNLYIAKINTWLDFIFIFFYSFSLYYTCKLLATSFNGFLFITGRLISRGALAAGTLDVLENTGMLITLDSHVSDICTMFTFIFSFTKWMIVLTAVAYILITGPTLLYKKIKFTPSKKI